MAYGDIYASQGNTLEDWLKQMNGQQESGNPFSSANNEFSAQQDPQQDQINAVGGAPEEVSPTQPQAQQKPASGGALPTIGAAIGTYLTGGNPVGTAVGAGVGKMAAGYQAEGGMTDTSKLAEKGVATALQSYMGNEVASGAGDSVFGETVIDASAAGNAAVDKALGSTREATLGDLYKGGDVSAQFTVPRQNLMERGYDYAKNYVKNTTKGLIGGNFDAREGTGAFMNDFINGLENGGGIDTGIGAIKGGAYGEALGSGVNYVANNYQQPAFQPPPRFTPDEYKKKNRYA